LLGASSRLCVFRQAAPETAKRQLFEARPSASFAVYAEAPQAYEKRVRSKPGKKYFWATTV